MLGSEKEIVTALGPWPIVQAAVAIAILVGGYIAIMRTWGAKKPEAQEAGVQMYLDGPVVSALAALERIAKAFERVADVDERLDEHDRRLRELESSMAVLEDRARR